MDDVDELDQEQEDQQEDQSDDSSNTGQTSPQQNTNAQQEKDKKKQPSGLRKQLSDRLKKQGKDKGGEQLRKKFTSQKPPQGATRGAARGAARGPGATGGTGTAASGAAGEGAAAGGATAGGGAAAAGGAAGGAESNPVGWIVTGVILLLILLIVIILIVIGGGSSSKAGEIQLTITKTGPTTAKKDDPLPYQITVAYPGPAQDIVITDHIPEGTDYVDSNPAAKFDPATRIATWNLKDSVASPPASLNNVNTTIALNLRATQDNTTLVNIAEGIVVGAGGGGPVNGDVAKLLPNPLPADPPGVDQQKQDVLNIFKQNPGNLDVYKQASGKTGVPWQVFAGIHYREGGADPNQSLVSGRPIGGNEPDVTGGCNGPKGVGDDGIAEPVPGGCGFSSLLDTAIYSGNELKGKIGGDLQNFENLVTALSRYNGGGNANCGNTPYTGCPKLFYGEDDTYTLNLFDDKHGTMYIVYCADHTKCNPPKQDSRPGTVTVTKWVAQNIQ